MIISSTSAPPKALIQVEFDANISDCKPLKFESPRIISVLPTVRSKLLLSEIGLDHYCLLSVLASHSFVSILSLSFKRSITGISTFTEGLDYLYLVPNLVTSIA